MACFALPVTLGIAGIRQPAYTGWYGETVKWLVVLAILGGGGYFAYKRLGGASGPPIDTYKRFADAYGSGRWGDARALSNGAARSAVDVRERAESIRVTPRMPRMPNVTAEQLKNEIAGPVMGTKQTIESITKSADGGRAALRATSKVCRETPGCTGLRCQSCRDFTHQAEVCRSGENWVVCGFSETDDAAAR